MIAVRSSIKTLLLFIWRIQSFTLISLSILVWAFFTWVNPWCMTFTTTILRPSKVIRQNYSSPTPTLSLMKLGPKIFTKKSTPTLRNDLTLVTTQLIIHLKLKQDLIVKCLECLRMKQVGSRLLNLLVWELNYTQTKFLMAMKIKNERGWQRMLQYWVFNSMTTESVWLEGRNNTEKRMSYRVNVMGFIPKRLIKLPSHPTIANELLRQTEYRSWLADIQT